MQIPPILIVSFSLVVYAELSCGWARLEAVVDTPAEHDVHEPRPLPTAAANDVRALAVDSGDRVWAATRDGVFITSPGERHWEAVSADERLRPAFAIAAADAGTVWAGTWDGLYRLTPSSAERVTGIDEPVAVVAAKSGVTVATGPEGFFMLRNDRLERFEPDCTRYLNRAAIAEDGTWWFATAMGLFRWNRGEGSYLATDVDRVSADVRGVAFGDRGEIWAAALGGVQVFRNGKLRRLIDSKDGLPSNDVRCIARAPDDRIWVGTAQGVARWNGTRWAVRHSRRWLLHDEVRDIAFSDDGAAWIATAGGVSVLRRQHLTMAAKADRFQRILEARHVRPPGIVEKCRLRKPGDLSTWTPMDDDNDGGYTAVFERHRYDRNALEAPNLNPAWRTHIDSELLAFAYPALLALERDPKLARLYRSSFERWYGSIKMDRTPFFEFLYAAYGKADRADLAGAIASLRDTPLDLIRWTVDNSRREDIRLRRVPEAESLQTDRLLPPSEIGFSRTDQNPWRARQGDGGNSEGDGVFWLLPYWMGRYYGFLPGFP